MHKDSSDSPSQGAIENKNLNRPAAKRVPAVGFIFVTILLDIIGIGLIIPVLPGVVGELTSDPQAQAFWYGLLAVAFGLSQFVFSPLLGALSDRFGRRPVLLLGIVGMGFNFIVTATADSLGWFLFSRLVGGACAANLAVAHAYIADFTPPEDRAKRFGMMGAAFGIGFIIGPVIGGLLGEVSLRLPFFAAAVISLLNAAYGMFILPESLPKELRQPIKLSSANPFGSMLHLLRLRGIWPLIISNALINLAQFVLHSVWVLYTSARFGWGPRENGFSLFVAGLVAAVVQGGLLSRFINRFGVQHLTIWGMISATIAYLLFGLSQQGWEFYAVMIANILAYAAAPAVQSLISQAASSQEQGLTMGGVNSLRSLMTVAAPLLATPLFAVVSTLPAHDWRLGAPFFLASLIAFAALLFAWLYFHKQTPAATQN